MTRRFSSLAGVTVAGYNVSGDGAPERAQTAITTANLLHTLGLVPVLGRDLRADDERARPASCCSASTTGSAATAARATSVGRTLQLNGRPYTIVGVAPRALAYPERTDLIVPLRTDTTLNRRSEFLQVVGRLAPGATFEAAQAEMATIATRLATEYPETNGTIRTDVVPLGEQLLGNARPAVLTLMGAVALVLLVACGNVANLLLARAAERERELAVRAGLGASRGRLARQMITESFVLALGGGALGLGLAAAAVRALRTLAPDVLPRIDEVRLDPWVAIFALGVSVLAGLTFGVAPALRAGRADLQTTLRSGGRGLAGQSGLLRLRGLLVGGEVALSVVLLVVGALLLRSFGELQRVPTGFTAEHLLTAKVTLPRARYPDDAASSPSGTAYRRAPRPSRACAPPGWGRACRRAASPTAASRSRGCRGPTRTPCRTRRRTTCRPAISRLSDPARSRAPARPERRSRGGARAGDQRDAGASLLRRARPDRGAHHLRRLHGLRDRRGHRGRHAAARPRRPAVQPGLRPVAQEPPRSAYLTLRTSGDPTALAAAVRRSITELDPTLPVYDVRSMEERLADDVARPRLTSALTSAFALAAIILAAVGISGVVAYAVGQRTRELGVRQALGARPDDIVRLVVRQGMAPVVVGIVVGLLAAGAAARAVRGLLFGVGAADPLTYVLALAFLGSVAFVATWLPARRALRVAPAEALLAD
jgi:cell division protein FtsX